MSINAEWAQRELQWIESVEKVITALAKGFEALDERIKRLEEGKEA